VDTIILIDYTHDKVSRPSAYLEGTMRASPSIREGATRESGYYTWIGFFVLGIRSKAGHEHAC
jgi:hypothetical protein